MHPAPKSARLLNRRVASLIAAGAMVCLVPTGCRTSHNRAVGLPARHSVKADQLLVLSDFKLPQEHPLIQDLVKLRQEVSQTLKLPMQSEQVVVYLFKDELSYHQYLQATHPTLPARRAYFIASREELAVYTYWGERIQEDLRHEYTHGLLHASLDSVPLWLDEGLAEYFEVAGARAGGVNREYAERLGQALANGWRPSLDRLEQLEKLEQMQRADYREAWAWIHYCLQGNQPEAREQLLSYLTDLRMNSKPAPLSGRLAKEIPEVETRFIAYVATLGSLTTVQAERP